MRSYKTDFLRKKLCRDRLENVNPHSVSLGIINGKKRHLHYVPIEYTLKATFEDKSLNININLLETQDPDVSKDFTDGYAFQRNDFFYKKFYYHLADIILKQFRDS